ncbi:MAG: sialidase family protein [Alsobacter sp.]
MSHPAAEQTILLDEHRYVAHPHMAVLPDGTWLLVVNRAPRRVVTMHPPQDPEFTNVLMRSHDEGATWTAPVVVPSYGATGTECAGLTVLPDGAVVLNQWQFGWFSPDDREAAAREPDYCPPEVLKAGLLGSTEIGSGLIADMPAARLMPWARGGGITLVHRSEDAGRTFPTVSVVRTAPYSGGYGMRGAVVLPDGEVLLPLSDIPRYERIFLVRSRDGGRSWGPPSPVAAVPGCEFEEPAPLLLATGEILLLLRENASRTLFATRSADGGRSWSTPRPTGIGSYPAHLVGLPDGRIAAVTGRRHPPFGIEAYLSRDGGRSFDADRPATIRAGLPNKDLGYPTAALRRDGSLFVAYYYRNASGVTGLHATSVTI